MAEIRFRRHSFYGKFADTIPKWHIHVGDDPGKWGKYTALCGYEYNNIIGDLAFSKAKQRPSRAQMCRKCLTEELETDK